MYSKQTLEMRKCENAKQTKSSYKIDICICNIIILAIIWPDKCNASVAPTGPHIVQRSKTQQQPQQLLLRILSMQLSHRT